MHASVGNYKKKSLDVCAGFECGLIILCGFYKCREKLTFLSRYFHFVEKLKSRLGTISDVATCVVLFLVSDGLLFISLHIYYHFP